MGKKEGAPTSLQKGVLEKITFDLRFTEWVGVNQTKLSERKVKRQFGECIPDKEESVCKGEDMGIERNGVYRQPKADSCYWSEK